MPFWRLGTAACVLEAMLSSCCPVVQVELQCYGELRVRRRMCQRAESLSIVGAAGHFLDGKTCMELRLLQLLVCRRHLFAS